MYKSVYSLHLLTATCNQWHIKNSKKIKKRWYYSTAHWQL